MYDDFMLRLFLIIFMTLVQMAIVDFADAATHTPSPDSQNPALSTPPKPKNQEELSTLNLSEEKPPLPKGKSAFYSYTQSISPLLGIEYDFFQPHDLSNVPLNYFFGIAYMFHSITNEHWEVGADLQSNSRFYLNGGYKWIFEQFNEFRIFVKTGLSLRFDNGAGFATFVDYKRYQARGTIGFEKLYLDPISLRVQLDFQFGADEISALLGVGYSWGW